MTAIISSITHYRAPFSRLANVALLPVAALMAFGAAPATAQDAGGLLNQQQQQQRIQMPDRLPSQEELAPAPVAPAPQGPTVEIKSIEITGGEGLATQAELDELTREVIGQRLSMADLQNLTTTITGYLRSKGWPLAQAYLPPQDITEGSVKILILRGHVERQGAIVVAENARLSKSIAKSFIDGALPEDGATPSQSQLERGVLLLKDLPGITATSTLERGEEPNSTRMVVNIEEGPWYSGYASYDNYGNRYTGKNKYTAGASLNNPLGIGDQLTVTGSFAASLWMKGAGYSLPIGSDGLRLSGNFTELYYKIRRENINLGSSGRARTFDIAGTYPVIRSRETNLSASLGYTYKSLRDKTLSLVTSDRRIHSAKPGLTFTDFDQFGGGGLTSVSLTGTIGTLDRSRVESDQQTDSTSALTSGGFSKANYSVARLQNVASNLSLFGAINGQLAEKNLDSSEKLILGGPSGVRGYPGGEASGDEGIMFNVELRYDVPADLPVGQLQLLTFIDHGRIKLNDSPWDGAVTTQTKRNRYTLSSVGLGANLTMTDYYSIRGSYAHVLGENPGRTTSNLNSDGKHQEDQFWIQSIFYF